MLLSRYTNINFVLDMSVDDGIELILKAYQGKEEDRAFGLYTAKYQDMTEKNYIPFNEFYNPKKQTKSKKTTKEILDDVKEILNTFKKEGETVGII